MIVRESCEGGLHRYKSKYHRHRKRQQLTHAFIARLFADNNGVVLRLSWREDGS